MTISVRIFLGFLIVIALSVIDTYVNYLLSLKVNQNSDFLAKSEAIIRNSSRLHKIIMEMQGAHRGYLLTDDRTFLDPYYQGIKNVPRLIKQENNLIGNNRSQRIKLDSIMGLHQQWVNYANTLIQARQGSQSKLPNNYQELFETKFKTQVGKKINDEITVKFQEFDLYEYRIREERRQLLSSSIIATQYYSWLFIILTVLIGFVSILFIIKLISKRIASMVSLADNISKGNFVTFDDQKRDELSALSKSLNLMSETLNKNIKELEKRNRELDQYAYVVSHDLKAPIRGIYNAIQWIEEDLGNELSPQMKEYLSIIPGRIKRIDDLIDGLLDYARVSRGNADKEVVDVKLLLAEIKELIIPEHFKMEIRNMPVLNTDKIRLEQVFSNLISNAVKYTSVFNVPKISVHCKELTDFYEFRVIDNGIGIDPQYHEKIFVIFQTLREKNAKESTGIGLAIVHKIIEDLHCSIRVRSEQGKGASFIFTWPKN